MTCHSKMDLNLVKQSFGFAFCTNDDYDKAHRLKDGTVVKATVKQFRNYKFHKLFFSLIRCAWEHLTSEQRNFFHGSVEQFRHTLILAAGFYDTVYSLERHEWQQIPKSIAFDKMEQDEFNDLYEKVKEVLFDVFLKDITEQEFSEDLIRY